MSFRKIGPLDLFMIVFVLMYYGRLSVVLFLPQYAVDNGIPSPYYSLHFAMISIGSAISNLSSIVLLRHVNPKMMFLAIGVISAAYEILLFFSPTPEALVISGFLIGLAAGSFWTLTFLMVCEIIDTHKVSSTNAFTKYNILTTVMGALTPLAAGIIVQWTGYGVWLISALIFLILSTGLMAWLKDPIYYKTYGEYPIKEDISKVLKDKRTLITFLLVMLFSTLTINTWASLSRVFFANIGIRNVWLGLLSVLTSVITVGVFYMLARKKLGSRRAMATLGIIAFGVELLLVTFTSDPLLVFFLEGVVGASGAAVVAFATQDIIKNTFQTRTYIGRPLFALGMHIGNSIWFAVCGYIIAAFGGYAAVGSLFGVTVDQYGFKVLLLLMTVIVAAWAVTMWKYEGMLAKGQLSK